MPWRTSRSSNSAPGGRQGLRPSQRLAIVASLVAVLVASLVSAAFAGVFTKASSHAAAGSPTAAREHSRQSHPSHRTPSNDQRMAGQQARAQGKHAKMVAWRPRTLCTTAGHIGDSTSVGMVSPQWLPNPAERLSAQYARVGVKHVWADASGGRSIVEEMPGQINGYKVAQKWNSAGFKGCWVFALGTNDTANVSVGSNVGIMARIQEMMSAAHGQPVMWVNTQTELTSGPWSEANMQAWNADLVRACAAYPNLRIFNWAGQVQPSWHLSDGIHYTSAGYAIRAKAIADALAKAFPADGHSKGCIVN